MQVHRFVALGDSFTEGLHDEVGPGGRHLGWADRVAAALARQHPGLAYANLAVRGRLLEQVIDEQVGPSLRLAPDLVSFHAGGNDVLRPGVEVAALAGAYDRAVGTLRTTGAEVVLFTVLESVGRSGPLARRLSAHIARFNAEVVRPAAVRHGAHLVDVGGCAALHDARLWHEDRLHLAPAGHRRIAAAVLETLGVPDPDAAGRDPGWWAQPLPVPASAGPVTRGLADLRWTRRHLAPWVLRRVRGVSSGDALSPKRADLAQVTGPEGG